MIKVKYGRVHIFDYIKCFSKYILFASPDALLVYNRLQQSCETHTDYEPYMFFF